MRGVGEVVAGGVLGAAVQGLGVGLEDEAEERPGSIVAGEGGFGHVMRVRVGEGVRLNVMQGKRTGVEST